MSSLCCIKHTCNSMCKLQYVTVSMAAYMVPITTHHYPIVAALAV